MGGVKAKGRVVCVTGASGYIASWLVNLLLQGEYTVKATVRDTNDPKKTEHLLALEGAKERLHLFKADLLEEGVFDSVVEGCEGVFHTASPVNLSPTNPQVEVIDPAVKGTINLLKSCAKVPSVKRVVLTSSMAAVVYNKKPLTPDVVVDETWYSDPEFCEASKLWYMLSKTLAEEAAWRFSKESGIDMVSINPGFVIGPPLQAAINLTLEDFLKLINGAQTFSSDSYRYVDVRDIAYAHIQAFEKPIASGRCCVVARVVHCCEALKILRELYPSLCLPAIDAEDKSCVAPYQVSNEKAKSWGINFTPLAVTIRDTVESLKKKGLLSF